MTAQARLPAAEWAHREAAGALSGVGWIEPGLDPERPAWRVVEVDGETRFHGTPLAASLPTPMVEAITAAVDTGDTPLLDGVSRVLGRTEWLVTTRARLWTPLSPVPGLLAALVEAYGVGVEIHRLHPERLARLAARLPAWYPARGDLEAARALLDGAVGEPLTLACAQPRLDGSVAATPGIAGEVFACRDLDWWRLRAEPGASPAYRIAASRLHFQPETGPHYRLLREDIAVAEQPASPVPASLLRLLPVWTSLRVVTPTP